MKIALVTAFALLAAGVLVAVGAPTSTVLQGCSGGCSCPAPLTGPGWCPTNGDAPCHCQGAQLCPGWCLAIAAPNFNAEPTPCDAGAAPVESDAGDAESDASDASATCAPGRQEEVGSDSTGASAGSAGPDGSDAALDAGSGAADAPMPGLVACKGPQDCENSLQFLQLGVFVTCCVAGTCIFGDQATQSSCGNPNGQIIAAGDYDLSCASDSDCTLVRLGDLCSPVTECTTGVISQSALSKYQADVAQTYAAQCFVESSCPITTGCCRNGQCVADMCFPQPGDTLPECADAGGICQNTGTLGEQAVCTGSNVGPPDSCAYSDETCCLTSR